MLFAIGLRNRRSQSARDALDRIRSVAPPRPGVRRSAWVSLEEVGTLHTVRQRCGELDDELIGRSSRCRRALVARPKLMMLDEPSLGLSPILVKMLFEMIDDLNQNGLTILLVEENTRMALQTAHRGYVLELGSVALSGASAELRNNPRLEEVYLGQG